VHLLKADGIIDGKPGRGTIPATRLTARKRRVSQVALIFGSTKRTVFREQYLLELLKGAMIGSDDHEVDIRILSTKTDGLVTPRELQLAGADGAVLCSISNPDYLALFAEAGMPVVAADAFAEDIP
jgi:DNA-binding LacI/PurR family transcriptional regulator